MDSLKGSNGDVRVSPYGWGSGDVTISIVGGNERSTGLEWRDARRLAYAILNAVDRHVDRALDEREKPD